VDDSWFSLIQEHLHVCGAGNIPNNYNLAYVCCVICSPL